MRARRKILEELNGALNHIKRLVPEKFTDTMCITCGSEDVELDADGYCLNCMGRRRRVLKLAEEGMAYLGRRKLRFKLPSWVPKRVRFAIEAASGNDPNKWITFGLLVRTLLGELDGIQPLRTAGKELEAPEGISSLSRANDERGNQQT